MTSSTTKVNLACGSTFISGDGWINFDYVSSSPAVNKANLLGRLPLADETAALVYSSHFVEHIPRSDVPAFLSECHRVLSPGGVLRLVLPDLENLCRTYLAHRERNEHGKANFVVLEMLDQCVRRDSGGELGRYYQALRGAPTEEVDMIDYVKERTGEDLMVTSRSPSCSFGGGCKNISQRLHGRLEQLWIRAVLALLPRTFRAQNVSLAGVGERHHWLWDFEQLRVALDSTGFVAIERSEATTSRFAGFPFTSLDAYSDGHPRKGAESMYIEAQKPG